MCRSNTCARPARPIRRQPFARRLDRRIEEQPAGLDEEDARCELERAPDALLGEDDRGSEPLDRAEEELGRVGIELGGRLVEQEQSRLQRERRRKADALELAARELGGLSLPQVEGVHGGERRLDARPDLGGRRAEVLEPESDLVRDDREDDLILRILEDRGDRSRQIGGSRGPRIQSRDDSSTREAAAVKMRDEARERPQQRRLAGSRRAEQRHDLARLELQRERPERVRRSRIRELELVQRG